MPRLFKVWVEKRVAETTSQIATFPHQFLNIIIPSVLYPRQTKCRKHFRTITNRTWWEAYAHCACLMLLIRAPFPLDVYPLSLARDMCSWRSDAQHNQTLFPAPSFYSSNVVDLASHFRSTLQRNKHYPCRYAHCRELFIFKICMCLAEFKIYTQSHFIYFMNEFCFWDIFYEKNIRNRNASRIRIINYRCLNYDRSAIWSRGYFKTNNAFATQCRQCVRFHGAEDKFVLVLSTRSDLARSFVRFSVLQSSRLTRVKLDSELQSQRCWAIKFMGIRDCESRWRDTSKLLQYFHFFFSRFSLSPIANGARDIVSRITCWYSRGHVTRDDVLFHQLILYNLIHARTIHAQKIRACVKWSWFLLMVSSRLNSILTTNEKDCRKRQVGSR